MMMPLAGVVNAANWQSTVVVPTTVEYDSNPLLLTSEEKGVTRTIIAPDYNLIGQFDRDQLRLGLGMHLLRSSDRSVVDDREDPNLSLGWQRQTETGGFGLLAQYNESSTLSGTVLDTGVVTTDGTQKMSSLTANWSSAVTERSTLANETRYNHARYDIDTLTGYDEYSNYSSWTYAWSERTDLITGLEARRYEPQDTTTRSPATVTCPASASSTCFPNAWKVPRISASTKPQAPVVGAAVKGGRRCSIAVRVPRPALAPIAAQWPAPRAVSLNWTWCAVAGATWSPKPAGWGSRLLGRTPRAKRPIPCRPTACGPAASSRGPGTCGSR